MSEEDGFWKLDRLSDGQLLESLGAVLHDKRRALAELVAHLGEVEHRRLHLEAAQSSLFAYCAGRLGMSEDEACRRIELARLARRFPALFPELAAGRISLSVALLLKPVLAASNQQELLAAVRGKSLQQARECLAAHFPRPDVPSSVRKLPERRPVRAPNERCPPERTSVNTISLPEGSRFEAPELALLQLGPPEPVQPELPLREPSAQPAIPLQPSVLTSPVSAPAVSAPSPPTCRPAPPPSSSRSRSEPLSAQRYKIQFTADAELKDKLERARELLRHAHPSGDFALIVGRALDLLLADLLRRRFGAGTRRRAASSPSPESAGSGIRRAARRAVFERDGLGCSWVDVAGVRCGARAWLELDHRHPRGQGGSSEPENLRLLCRAHNQLAAEHAYGREHIERAIAARRIWPEP